MIDENIVEKEIESLKHSLLYQMSLGARELYHSNIWAWLIHKDPEFVKVFFPEFDDNLYVVKDVSREFHNRDLIIWLQLRKGEEKYFYVIENKLKSLPSEQQLKDYTEDVGNGDKLLAAVYTGIVSPLEGQQRYGVKNTEREIEWRFVPYSDISQEIRNIIGKSKKIEDETKVQILEYCKTIESMQSLLDTTLANNPQKWKLDVGKLADSWIRLDDVYRKLKGADLISYFQSNIPKERFEKDIAPWKLYFGQSYHNKKPTLDIRFTNWKENCESAFDIGIQIEGMQYRRMAFQFQKSKLNHEDGKILFEQLKDEWFDSNFTHSSKALFDRPTAMRDSYCKYKGNDWVFVYQYFDIRDDNNDYEWLSKRVYSDLEEAYKFLLRHKIPFMG